MWTETYGDAEERICPPICFQWLSLDLIFRTRSEPDTGALMKNFSYILANVKNTFFTSEDVI